MKLTKEEQTKQLQEVQQQLKEAQEKLKQIENAEVIKSYTLVPNCISIFFNGIQPLLRCRDRSLFIAKGSGIWVTERSPKETQFKILHTPTTKFKNSKIYFCTNYKIHPNHASLNDLCMYGIWCKKDMVFYYWNSNEYNTIGRSNPMHWKYWYPVVPVKE